MATVISSDDTQSRTLAVIRDMVLGRLIAQRQMLHVYECNINETIVGDVGERCIFMSVVYTSRRDSTLCAWGSTITLDGTKLQNDIGLPRLVQLVDNLVAIDSCTC